MQYVVSWTERPQGSAAEYEQAQKRILGTFRHWQPPEGMEITAFVICVGHYGGYMMVTTDDPGLIHRTTSSFPAFAFRVEAVLPMQEAVERELEAIAWRDGLPAA